MSERVITNLLKDVKIPKMVLVHQKFKRPKIADQMVYQSEKTLGEVGDKIPADEKG